MAERRKAKRKSISYYIQVLDADNQKVIGNLADVSTVGVMIDSHQPLPVGQELRFRVDTTPEVANVLNIDFVVRVKWCQMDNLSPGIYDIGLELVSISPTSADALARIADKYGSRESS
ncbi:MAG: PilZ domain-containing protein [Chloroflexi bacterium]|nr:PilZ domain-containing protein [Chloroflexota bacterium]